MTLIISEAPSSVTMPCRRRNSSTNHLYTIVLSTLALCRLSYGFVGQSKFSVNVIIHRKYLSSFPKMGQYVYNDSNTDEVENSIPFESDPSAIRSTQIDIRDNIVRANVPTSVLLLNLVAILWGSQHAVVKLVVDDSDVAAWSLTRFGLAALLAAPFTPSVTWNNEITRNPSLNSIVQSPEWRWGLEMGFWMFLGYAFQAIGLEYTTAQRSGFLLYLNVKFVPFLARILLGRSISIMTWTSALTAFLGTALLSFDGTSPSLNVGDLWSIAAAVASAMYILRLEQATIMVKNSASLNSSTLWTVTVLSLFWCILHNMWDGNVEYSYSRIETIPNVMNHIFESVQHTITQHPWELVYLGGVTTALSNYIQTKAQGNISAERAAVIYAMDPVYGAMFSYWILGEQLNVYGIIGACLITLAAAANSSLDLSLPNKQGKD